MQVSMQVHSHANIPHFNNAGHRKKKRLFTFSISNFLLMVMHLFKRSLYFSSNFCCSSICLLRSQFACEAENDTGSADIEKKNALLNIYYKTELWEVLSTLFLN